MNARRIAQVLQAERNAPEQFHNAERLYQTMIAFAMQGKKPSKQLVQMAKVVRRAMRRLEPSRLVNKRNRQKK
jgi:hypothetical protein